jgi:hypothetical protein
VQSLHLGFSLVSKLAELRTKKKTLVELNSSKKKFVEGLVVRLKALAKSALPLQQCMPTMHP